MKHKVLITITLILASLAVQAQNIIRPKVECPNGIYVNSYNGVLFYQRPDVSVTNRNMRLEAVFYYNSSSNEKNYGYGNGWSLGSELRYIEDSLGVIIVQGDGRQDLYTRYGNSFEAPAGVFSTLSIEGNGYLLTYKDGTRYYFSDAESKKVTLVKDRYDNSITYAYQDGNLVTATDISDRSLNFTWADSLLVGLSTSFDDRTWSYQYDEKGNLTCVTDPMGYSVYYAYDKDNRIKTFTDAEGYSTHISYNVDGMAHRVKTDLTDKSIRYELAKRQTVFVDYLKDANNQFSTYIWDEKGRVIEKQGNCCGLSSKLAYDDDNNVIRKEDANGNVTTYTYDQYGNMLSITDALGNTEYFTYESTFFNPTSYTDKKGNRYTFTYDSQGNLTTMTTPLNTSVHYTYNQYGQILTTSDFNNNITQCAYDNYGNMISKTDALNHTTTVTYTPQGLIQSVIRPNSGIVQYTYNRDNQMTQIINPLNYVLSMEYDNKGSVIEVTNPLNNRITLAYNALGLPQSVTGPMNDVVRHTYNAKLKAVQTQDAMNHVSRNVFDDRDRIIMPINALNDTTRYYYDNIGLVIGVELPTGQFITYQYDALNRPISMADQLGTIQTLAYDANGNVVSMTDAEGHTTTYQYDALNRLLQFTNTEGYSEYYSYDNNGNVLSHTDANGNTTFYTYDALNHMLTQRDAINNVTSYTYDANGNIASVTDARGNTTSYQYDANDQLTKMTFANGKTRVFTYDANGNKASFTNENGHRMTYTYDALSRLIQKTYPNNTADSYTYDANGNLLAAVNADAQVSFTYDAVGQVLSETLNGKSTTYAYDIRNKTLTKTYPNGRTITEEYDYRLRLMDIKENNEQIVTWDYNLNNLLTQRAYGNGTGTSYVYNTLNYLTQLTDNNNISNVQMSYDAVGNILSKKDMFRSNQSEVYGYDALNRLTNFKQGEITTGVEIPNPLKQVQYGLDALGNRTTITINGEETQYTADNMNAYSAITGAQNMTPQYDNNGNMTSDGTHTYQYNYNNRLISVDNGATATYKYDALNRRIQKTVVSTGSTTNYYYSGDQAIEERNANDVVLATYIFGVSIDDVMQMQRSGNTYFYHKDHLGSVVALSDGDGNLVERYEYDPYGHPWFFDANSNALSQSTVGNTILYTGRDYDVETGMYYYRARTMHPGIGRFMQHDQYMYFDGYNLYRYVGNNPTNYVDYTGNSADCVQDGINAWCKEHPLKCKLLGLDRGAMGNVEVCFFVVIGGCLDISIGLEKDGANGSWKPTANIGATLGLGVELSITATATMEWSDPDAKTSSNGWVAAVGVEAGVGIGEKMTYNKENGVGTETTIGVIVAGMEGQDGPFYVGGSVGLGGGGHVGYHWGSDK